MQYMNSLLCYTESADPEQIFQLLDILGQGAYGSVHKALHKQTGALYAIKILPATSINQISSIKKEIAILKQCNDEHIVKYYGSYFKDNNLWIVMQYCSAGSITDVVNITQKQLDQYEIASILQCVIKGLVYLHQRKKIHRDIKAANILLNQTGAAKLADFGVSTQQMHTNARHNTHIGSPYWMSPQVMRYSDYNQKTDIWSLGVTAIQLAEGIVPYSHLKPFMAMWTMKQKPIQSLKQPHKWSQQFNSFIHFCLAIKPEDRPEAKQLLNHEFIVKKSRGKRLISQLVTSSMAQIQQYRQGQQRNHSSSQLMLIEKGSSKNENNEQIEIRTVIRKDKFSNASSIVNSNSNKNQKQKDYQYDQQDSISAIKKSKNENDNQQYEEGSSVIYKQDSNYDHSRTGSMVVNKDSNANTNQNKNILFSYIQNLQSQKEKQFQLKQKIQKQIFQLELQCFQKIQQLYMQKKKKIQDFIQINNKSVNNQKSQLKSSLAYSTDVVSFLCKIQKYNFYQQLIQLGKTSKIKEQQKQQNNQKQVFEIFQIKSSQQFRKKSFSSSESPNSLNMNNKISENIKTKQKLLEKTPNISLNKFKQLVNFSANFNPSNKSLVSNNNPIKNQKRATITQPHENYQFEETISSLGRKNLRQFLDDDVVRQNLKQCTQQSDEIHDNFSISHTQNRYEPQNEGQKHWKTIKSRDKKKINRRQEQRPTHIAHKAVQRNQIHPFSSTNVCISKKKDRYEELQKQKSPQISQYKCKSKKAKSKNKQTASTTIPFGSTTNIGSIQFFTPNRIITQSKQKKGTQKEKLIKNTNKNGPFSKIKNR